VHSYEVIIVRRCWKVLETILVLCGYEQVVTPVQTAFLESIHILLLLLVVV
jgi:hypothetical protein